MAFLVLQAIRHGGPIVNASTLFDSQVVGALPVVSAFLQRLKLADIIDKAVPWEGDVPLGIFFGGAAGTPGFGISSSPPVRSISVWGAERNGATSTGSIRRPLFTRRGG